MIIDLEKFASLSYGSAQRVLCRCDGCGIEKNVIMQSLTKYTPPDYPFCRACSSRAQGKRNQGIKRSDSHKMKTGVASRARNAGQVLGQWSKDHPQCREANPKWKADREQVKRNALARIEIQSLLHNTLRRIHAEKTTRTEIMLGYSKSELLKHLEKQFVDDMTWDNRGQWHIDHIKPVSEFIKEGVTDVSIINALDNLRPLWASENLSRRFNNYQVRDGM